MAYPPAPLPVTDLDGRGLRIGIIIARYNWHITGTMLALAQEALVRLGVAGEDIYVVSVPGSFELATIAQAMLAHESYDALICFGCVIKGATRHDVVVSDAAAYGIQQVALNTGVPIIFGVMCAENQQQAEERVDRGQECAQTAVEMAQTIRRLKNNRDQEERVWTVAKHAHKR
jgi:6,7-dimethyl-8-ribityllumazine synthase